MDSVSARKSRASTIVTNGYKDVSGTATEALAPFSSAPKSAHEPRPLATPPSKPINSTFQLRPERLPSLHKSGRSAKNPTISQTKRERDEMRLVPNFCRRPTAPQQITATHA